MVQASTLIIAAFAVAPVLAAPLHETSGRAATSYNPHHNGHSATAAVELEAREPKFSFKKLIGGAAKLLLRDEDGSIYERSVDDLDLDAREPKFSFKKLIGGAARILLRDEEGNVYERDVDDLDLDAREPKFSFKKLIGGAARILLRDEDGSIYERDVDDLEVREPKFSFKKLIGGAARLLLRDEDGGVYVYERDIDGADFHLRELGNDDFLDESDLFDMDEMMVDARSINDLD